MQPSEETANTLAAAKRGSPLGVLFSFIARGLLGISIIVTIGLFIFRGWEAGTAGLMVVLRQFALILITYSALIEPIDWVYKNAKYRRVFPGEFMNYGVRFLNARTANVILSGWLSALIAFLVYGSMRSAGNLWAPIVAITILLIGRPLLMSGIAVVLEMKLARENPEAFSMLNEVIE
ncbi:MAG: hypothetical protein U1E29_08000 [Coriobacteriia bacterium]|nr:hypothetical protein [Coriobacteriia bacterium]